MARSLCYMLQQETQRLLRSPSDPAAMIGVSAGALCKWLQRDGNVVLRLLLHREQPKAVQEACASLLLNRGDPRVLIQCDPRRDPQLRLFLFGDLLEIYHPADSMLGLRIRLTVCSADAVSELTTAIVSAAVESS
eukprot:6867509-Prymnesium_polylepis.2